VLSTNHLTQAVGAIAGRRGPKSGYGQGDSGCVEKRFLFTKSDIFSATKVLAAGFNPVRASSRPRALQARGLRLLAPRRLLCQPSPNRAPNERKLYPCVATIALV